MVAVDEAERTVEIQNFDGTIGELEFDIWHELKLESAVAPEDWTGAVDVDQDALPELSDVTSQVWTDPLDFVDHLE